MSIPVIHSYDQIVSLARNKVLAGKPRAALVGLDDPDMLRAFARAAADGLITPIAFGEKEEFNRVCTEAGVAADTIRLMPVKTPDMPVIAAARLAYEDEIDIIVKGRILTADMLTVLFDLGAYYLTKGHTVSHVAVLQPEAYPKLLLLSDSAVVVEPNLQQKLALINNMTTISEAIGITMPRLAMLAAVEVIYPQMPVTIDGAVIAKMADRGQIKGALVDGPLSFDVAVDMEAALSKGVKNSEVAGQADGMIAPNIEVANGVYKAMALYGKCLTGGVIVGGRVPIAIGSRIDDERSKYHSIVLAVLTAG
jgi:phosphate butyryltransferase